MKKGKTKQPSYWEVHSNGKDYSVTYVPQKGYSCPDHKLYGYSSVEKLLKALEKGHKQSVTSSNGDADDLDNWDYHP